MGLGRTLPFVLHLLPVSVSAQPVNNVVAKSNPLRDALTGAIPDHGCASYAARWAALIRSEGFHVELQVRAQSPESVPVHS